MSDVTSDRWLSVDEIAEYLGVKRYTIYKWIERKNMPAHKVGSLWKFKKEEIDDCVRSARAIQARLSMVLGLGRKNTDFTGGPEFKGERFNDCHCTLAAKHKAREAAK